jgi:hypothetical protein
MRRSSYKPLADFGRILLGLLVTALGSGKFAVAVLHGQTKLFMFHVSFADRPIQFAAVVGFWILVLASGVSYIQTGIRSLRGRDGDASATS